MINLTFKPGALEKIMRANARKRSGWQRLEELAKIYDEPENRVLDVGIHGDVYPGGHKYMFSKASYETVDIDPNVMPTHVADIREMPFSDGTFDMIICHSVIEHVLERRKEAYGELYRVLRGGGVLVYFIPSVLKNESEPAKYVSRTELLDAHKELDYDFRVLEDGNMYLEIRK